MIPEGIEIFEKLDAQKNHPKVDSNPSPNPRIKTVTSSLSTYSCNQKPLVYEYAMILKVGDNTETDFVDKSGERLNQFKHYANKTYQLLEKLLKQEWWEDEEQKIMCDEDSFSGTGFCVEMYRSKPVWSDEGWVS